MKKNNYERPFLNVFHISIGEIFCNEINTSVGDIIVPGDEGNDGW